jgi:hypothetical protein
LIKWLLLLDILRNPLVVCPWLPTSAQLRSTWHLMLLFVFDPSFYP